jgi:hypothetical protein
VLVRIDGGSVFDRVLSRGFSGKVFRVASNSCSVWVFAETERVKVAIFGLALLGSFVAGTIAALVFNCL